MARGYCDCNLDCDDCPDHTKLLKELLETGHAILADRGTIIPDRLTRELAALLDVAHDALHPDLARKRKFEYQLVMEDKKFRLEGRVPKERQKGLWFLAA